MTKLERFTYPNLQAPVGPYVHAVHYDNLLYVSGLTAFGTPQQSGTLIEQSKEIFNQLRQIIHTEGIDTDNIIKVTVFITELDKLEELRSVAINFYRKNLPASSLVKVDQLFSQDLKIEIEAIFGF